MPLYTSKYATSLNLTWLSCLCRIETIQPLGTTCKSHKPCHLFISEATSHGCFYPVLEQESMVCKHIGHSNCVGNLSHLFPVRIADDRLYSRSAVIIDSASQMKGGAVLCPSPLLRQNDQSVAWLLCQHLAVFHWKTWQSRPNVVWKIGFNLWKKCSKPQWAYFDYGAYKAISCCCHSNISRIIMNFNNTIRKLQLDNFNKLKKKVT